MSLESSGLPFSEIVEQAGVVGGGGAGFPTHIKLKETYHTVIANGAECEPLLQSDKKTMEQETESIVEALELVRRSTEAEIGILAVKQKNGAAVELIREVLGRYKHLEIRLLESYYPVGDERVLIYETIGNVVPETKLPSAVGAAVFNIETLRNLYKAYYDEEPVTGRTISCIGEVAQPCVGEFPIGTSVRDIIECCGGATVSNPYALLGGPMMGVVTSDVDTPIDKRTNAVIILSEDHPLIRTKLKPITTVLKQSRAICCQCTYCTELCPRVLLGYSLSPHQMMRSTGYGLDVPLDPILSADTCSECGVCEVFACTMGLSPVRMFALIKERLRAEGYVSNSVETKPVPHPIRESRKVPTQRLITRLQLEDYDSPLAVRSREETMAEITTVEIPLQQHVGVTAIPVVEEGSRVAAGEVIGEFPGNTESNGAGNVADKKQVGARVHASMTGIVRYVDSKRIMITREEKR